MEYKQREIDINIWDGKKLGYYIALDTETTVVDFTKTPDLITLQAYAGKEVYYVPIDKVTEFFITHSKSVFIFANAPFDLDVLEKNCNWDFFPAVDSGRIYDVQLMYRLLKLATEGEVPFKYSLALLAKQYLNVELNKDDDIRCNFEQFKGGDLKDIPEEFLEYGALDVIVTYDIFQVLLHEIRVGLRSLNCLSHEYQLKGAIALNRIYKNGIGFDDLKAKFFLQDIQDKMNILSEILGVYGWVRGEKGSKAIFNRIVERAKIDLPTTKTGDYSSKEKDLLKYKNHHFIQAYLNYISLEKTTTFIRNLKGTRVHPRYNVLKNTGRTSCSNPNFQQLPREGDIRSMFQAEKDNTFIITDYSSIELSTLAQVLYSKYGENEMQKRINAGEDLHTYYASVLYKVPVEEVTKEQRQSAKAANFGFPGGLGIGTFIEFAEGYGLQLTEGDAQEMKDAWFEAFPLMKKYLQGEEGSVETLTGRKRANTTYCQEKNTPFQGLAADGAKLALYELIKNNFKVVGFVHDEIICEVHKDDADMKLTEQENIMIDSMKHVVPDVGVSVESTISKEYCK